MPPKKPADKKSAKGQEKALEKQKAKVAEDKTFGLKNKNKSKTVQKFVKAVHNQVKGNNVSETALKAKEAAHKEERKKVAQQQALLASLFKGTEAVKKAAESVISTTPESIKLGQAIDLYTDHRIQRDHADKMECITTEQVCKHFLEAVEKKQYGWFWDCPNGGDTCIYRHALPPGYVLKEDTATQGVRNVDDEETLEERVERLRSALIGDGTKVTLESFKEWKARKEADRVAAVEAARVADAKKTGGKGYGVLSGRDLFAYDPSLFIDDDAAADDEDYEEDQTYWEAVLNENQAAVDKANEDALAAEAAGQDAAKAIDTSEQGSSDEGNEITAEAAAAAV